MKILDRISAELILALHFLLVLLVIFGWALLSLWYFYMAALFLTLISDLTLGYCILSKWEFDLRKRINPKVDYDFAWATYYTYKITNKRISYEFYKRAAITFLILAIGINFYFKFWF